MRQATSNIAHTRRLVNRIGRHPGENIIFPVENEGSTGKTLGFGPDSKGIRRRQIPAGGFYRPPDGELAGWYDSAGLRFARRVSVSAAQECRMTAPAAGNSRGGSGEPPRTIRKLRGQAARRAALARTARACLLQMTCEATSCGGAGGRPGRPGPGATASPARAIRQCAPTGRTSRFAPRRRSSGSPATTSYRRPC